MIYTCWYCGHRINERTSNSEGIPYKIRNDNDPEIGKYLLYNHMPFCSEYCIDCFKQNKGPIPDRPKIADIYYEEWMNERKARKHKKL